MSGSVVSAEPHMEPEGFERLKRALSSARCYLEYGSGGSTVYACNEAQVPLIVSVDSDPRWVADVGRSLHRGPDQGVAVVHCDVGEVGDWGVPRSYEKVADFWRYMALPWEIARASSIVPDTVFIDGRFRVASFLYTLVAARAGTTILFDDYVLRPEYHVVEEFCRVESTHGRLAVFRASPSWDHVQMSARLAQYSVDWD